MSISNQTASCPLCSQLREVETSFYKYAAPEYDHPLPAAAAQLQIIKDLSCDEDRYHVRRCPYCATLYTYHFTYEYHMNGSEDEEILTRLTPDEATVYCRGQVQRLEAMRQEIDLLESAAGSLGDYLDRGHPSPAEAEEALSQMHAYRQDADQRRAHLQAQVDSFRQTYPEALKAWAEAHRRVCRGYLSAPDQPNDDFQTMRYVAQTTLEAWEKLPQEGETFISINTYWMNDYLDRLQALFQCT